MRRISRIASKEALMLPLTITKAAGAAAKLHEQNSSSKRRCNVSATLSRIGNDLSELLELNVLPL
jgi:phage-related protein